MPAKPARPIEVRSEKRSLHEETRRKGRKEPSRTQKLVAKNGFHLNDTVIADGRRIYITGFSKGNVYIKNVDGNNICQPGRSHEQFRCQTQRRSVRQRSCFSRGFIAQSDLATFSARRSRCEVRVRRVCGQSQSPQDKTAAAAAVFLCLRPRPYGLRSVAAKQLVF